MVSPETLLHWHRELVRWSGRSARGDHHAGRPGQSPERQDLIVRLARKMVAQRKYLRAELGVGAGADEDQVGDEASELVREAETHGSESCPDLPDHLRPRPSGLAVPVYLLLGNSSSTRSNVQPGRASIMCSTAASARVGGS